LFLLRRFTEFDPTLHESAREELKQGVPLASALQQQQGAAAVPGTNYGRSYMKTGSLTIFSDIAKEQHSSQTVFHLFYRYSDE